MWAYGSVPLIAVAQAWLKAEAATAGPRPTTPLHNWISALHPTILSGRFSVHGLTGSADIFPGVGGQVRILPSSLYRNYNRCDGL
jgi:hypothetical protein